MNKHLSSKDAGIITEQTTTTDSQPDISEKKSVTKNTTSPNRLFRKLKYIIWAFRPVYEIEWQENQWIQLEHTTNQYIEELYRRGFTRMVIRQDDDKHLKQAMKAANFSEYTSVIMLAQKEEEHNTSDKCESSVFSIRRKKWLHLSNENWLLVVLSENTTRPFFTENSTSYIDHIIPLSFTEPPCIINN